MRMRIPLIIRIVLLESLLYFALPAQVKFDAYFLNETLRLDYYHTGGKQEESMVLKRLVRYPYYAGNPDRLLDDLNRGNYLIRVFSLQDNQLIFSRGFSSMFNEWKTTESAIKGEMTAMEETILLPFPRQKVLVQFWERDRQNVFSVLRSQFVIDPASVWIQAAPRLKEVVSRPIQKSGDPSHSVDLVILGDGYTRTESEKFAADAKKYTEVLFSVSPFREFRKKFNVTAVLFYSMDSGVDMPDSSRWVGNALDFHFNTFGSARYALSESLHKIHDIAGVVPYDFILVLMNTSRYGGGGIYQFYAVSASDNPYSDYVFVHEFGHSFGGLGDEYYTSSVAYNEFYPTDVEPWEPNLTVAPSPTHLKWQSLLTPGIPVPTPWNKSLFDSLSSVNREQAMAILKDDPYYGKTGAMEGAGYSSRGIFRPSVDCIMFSRSLKPGFDPVCSKALEEVILFYTHSK